MIHDDQYYMRLALNEAKKAYQLDEVPIGAIIVRNGVVISRAYNQKTLKNVATYHAEVLAIEKACKKLNTWYLDECILYTTVEPCLMCTGAILQSRVSKVVYGTNNETFGYLSKFVQDKDIKIDIKRDVLKKECSSILTQFFQKKRNED